MFGASRRCGDSTDESSIRQQDAGVSLRGPSQKDVAVRSIVRAILRQRSLRKSAVKWRSHRDRSRLGVIGMTKTQPPTRRMHLLVFAVIFLAVPTLSAMPITLGEAGQFNALILGDMSVQRSDVEGRLAVGGNLEMSDYSVGLLLDDSDGGRDDLIVGGDAKIRDARIEYGNAVVAGSADIDETVGFYRDNPESPNGKLYNDSGRFSDFDALIDDVLRRSSAWGEIAATGQTKQSRNDEGALYDLRFEGGLGLNVFNVDAADFSSPNKSITFDIPASAVALVNVFGEDVELFNTGFYHTALGEGVKFRDNDITFRHDGALTNNILFNFVEATSLDIHSVGVKGSILAPHATTNFYNGHIDGNFIVENFVVDSSKDAGQVNAYQFIGAPQVTIAIDEPPMIWLFFGSMPILVVFFWRRPHNKAVGHSIACGVAS